MSRITFTPEQELLAQRNTFVAAPAPEAEYDQSAFTALARQMNTGIAYVNRERINNRTYDVSAYGDREVTKPEIRRQLEAQGIDPQIVDGVVASNVNSWHDVEARKTYLQGYYEEQRQISENFSTAESILYGLPMAVADPTMLLTWPIGGAVGKGAQTLNLATKLGRAAPVIQYGAVGALEAMADNAIYEQVTGVHEDNSMINAAVIGMALGGAVGVFSSKAAQQGGLSTVVDSSDRLLNARQAQEVKIATALRESEELQTLAREGKDIERLLEEATAELTAARAVDKEATAASRAATVQELNGQIETLTAARKSNEIQIRNLTKEIEADASTVKRAEAQIADINQTARFVDTKTATVRGLEEAINFRKQFPDGMPTKSSFIEQRVNAWKASGDTTRSLESVRKEAQAEFAQLKKRVSAFEEPTTQLRARLAMTNRELKRLQTKLNRIAPTEELATTVRDMERMLDNSRNRLAMKRNNRDALTATNKETKSTIETTRNLIKEGQKVVRNKDIQLSDGTVKLGELVDKYKADLSPEGIRTLAGKYESIQADINQMLDGKFSGLKSLYGVIERKQTFITKLQKELDDIDLYRDNMAESPAFKRIPSWMQKILISPIEKLMASENAMVRGLAQKLHAGTLHHGKANTMNAFNRRRVLDAQHNQMLRNIKSDYSEALKDGSFKGSLDEYYDAVGREAFKTTGATQRAAYSESYAGDVPWSERLTNAEQRLSGYSREYSTGNKHLRNSVDSVLDYYEGIHKRGSTLKMDAFMGSLSKGYMNRMYSKEAIEKLGRDVAIKRLVEAQEKFAIATNKPWGDTELADALEMATKAIDASLDPAARANMITKPLGVEQAAGTSVFKQRTIDAFDDDLIDLLETNIDGLSTMYTFKTHGRIALQEAVGKYKDADLEALIMASGATGKEVDRLRVVIDTIKGIREIDKNPAQLASRVTKALSSYSSLMHSMAFGVSSMTEVAAIAGEFGLGRTLKNFIGTPRDVYNMYKHGTPRDKNTIELFANFGDAHFSNRANRYDADTGFDSVGRVQAFLDKTNHYGSVFGGLLPVTDALRMTTASLTVDFLARMSVKSNISSTDMKRLLDMGFDQADLPRIRDVLNVSSDGRINNMDRGTWGKLDEEMQAAVQITMDRVILEPSGATLPAFMTDMSGGAFIPRIFTKFMRFPLESIERMTYRGMQEMDAKRAIGIATNVAMWSAVLAAKDALRSEDKQIYANEENHMTLIKDAFLYSSVVGGITTVADLTSGIVTGQNLTNDYQFRWGGVVLSDIGKLQRGNPTFSLPLYTVNIGEAVGAAGTTIGLIEETNK